MNQSESVDLLAASLALAMRDTKNPTFDAVNPHFKNRYATLGAHLDAVRRAFPSHGLSVIQGVETPDASRVVVTTRILHASGQWIESSLAQSLGSNAKVQDLGSAVTYLRRYSIAAMCGIVGDEDDDGESDRSSRDRAIAAPAPPTPPKRSSAAALTERLAAPSVTTQAIPAAAKKPTARKTTTAVCEDCGLSERTIDGRTYTMANLIGARVAGGARLESLECVILDEDLTRTIERAEHRGFAVNIEVRDGKTSILRGVTDASTPDNDTPF